MDWVKKFELSQFAMQSQWIFFLFDFSVIISSDYKWIVAQRKLIDGAGNERKIRLDFNEEWHNLWVMMQEKYSNPWFR
jgi:hypothetical protein